MLAPTIRLSASQKEDLAVVCELGSDKLQAVASKLQAENFTIRRSEIERAITDVLGARDGDSLATILFGIAGVFRRLRLTADDALDRVSQSLGEALSKDNRFRQWDKCRSILREILTIESVALAAKALDISYDFERVFVAGRVLTSVRPVFNDDRDDIRGSTIVQTLRLEYIGPDGGRKSISVAMDVDDIRQLVKECNHALTKATIARQAIESKCGWPAIIPGEEVSE